MSKTRILLLAVACAAVSGSAVRADEIPGFVDKFAVRSIVTRTVIQWATSPGGAHCPDRGANDRCTAQGAPQNCCSGAGAGNCHLKACRAFARSVEGDAARLAPRVEGVLHLDAAWQCSTTVDDYRSGQTETVCTVTPASPIDSIAVMLADMAQRRAGN